ncbi:hypothetical protein SDJN03_28517, partial [Cucurbita argyrosperma subsp. sororia]
MGMNRGAVWLVAAVVATRTNRSGHPSHGVASVSRLPKHKPAGRAVVGVHQVRGEAFQLGELSGIGSN